MTFTELNLKAGETATAMAGSPRKEMVEITCFQDFSNCTFPNTPWNDSENYVTSHSDAFQSAMISLSTDWTKSKKCPEKFIAIDGFILRDLSREFRFKDWYLMLCLGFEESENLKEEGDKIRARALELGGKLQKYK